MIYSNKKVLIIDDDPKFRSIIRKILEQKGVIIKEAATLSEAFTILDKITPDLVMLDLNLSTKVHGTELLKLRQEDTRLSLIPILVCSATSKKEAIKKVFELGATDYMIKPIRPDYLLLKIKKCLKDIKKVEYTLSENDKVLESKLKLEVWAEVVALSETHCQIRSPIKFTAQEKISINFSEFSNILSNPKTCISDISSRPNSHGIYDTYCTIIGIGEKEASQIRKLKSSWKKAI